MRPKLLLGTAQWGLNYGITNLAGRITDQDLFGLVCQARRLGVRGLDTASAYGDAQQRIPDFAPDFSVQTKISASGKNESELRRDIQECQRCLQMERIWGLLIHDWPVLHGYERSMVIELLSELRESGVVDRFGASVYTEDDLRTLDTHLDAISVVQLPVSIMDQRLLGSDIVSALRSMEVLIQARSIFLQGMLLSSVSRLALHPELVAFRREIKARNLDPVDVCVSFIKAQGWIDEVVIGVTSASEVARMCTSFSAEPLQLDWERWAATDEELLDPRRWPAS